MAPPTSQTLKSGPEGPPKNDNSGDVPTAPATQTAAAQPKPKTKVTFAESTHPRGQAHRAITRSFSCARCFAKFSSVSELEDHIRATHTETFLCIDCGERCLGLDRLKVHMDTDHPEFDDDYVMI